MVSGTRFAMRSIRWRLVASTIVVAVLAVGAVGALSVSLIRRATETRQLKELQINADALARQAGPILAAQASGEAHELRRRGLGHLVHTAAFLGNARVRILGPTRDVLADSGPRDPVDRLAWFAADEAADGQPLLLMPVEGAHRLPAWFAAVEPARAGSPAQLAGVISRVDGPWGVRIAFETAVPNVESLAPGKVAAADPARLADRLEKEAAPRSPRVVTAVVGPESAPIGFVELSEGPDATRLATRQAARSFALAGLGAIVLAAGIGLVVGRSLTAPLASLSGVAARMGEGDLTARARDPGQDEIGLLARQLNAMADRLQATFAALERDRDTLRRFVADASHQLRTPVTALANYNTLLEGPAAEDRAMRAEFVREAQAQIDRLESITRHLLDLSRLDAGIAALPLEDVEVATLVEASVAPFVSLARERGVRLSVEAPAGMPALRGDRVRLELAIGNLVDNALRASPAGAAVSLRAWLDGDFVVVAVADAGPGIPEAERRLVFERFYRGAAVSWPGSGLGLAFVKSVVEAHGGTVEAGPGSGGVGTLVKLRLPVDVG